VSEPGIVWAVTDPIITINILSPDRAFGVQLWRAAMEKVKSEISSEKGLQQFRIL
jgi:hypothetical protein